MHAFRHLHTILHHRHLVLRHCIRAGIPWQGLTHDLSKFAPVEFFAGARYYSGTHSPNEEERREHGYSLAWLHHKGRNRHHYEYWSDFNVTTHTYMPVEMPVRYTAEMFCDRVAASKTYQGKAYTDRHPIDYFTRGNAANSMHPATAALLSSWLTTLAESGEEAAFAEVKRAVRAAKGARREARRAR